MFPVRVAPALGCNVASSGARRARMSAVALSTVAKTACAFSASTLSANRTRPVAVSYANPRTILDQLTSCHNLKGARVVDSGCQHRVRVSYRLSAGMEVESNLL